jgi:2-polyprenyl-6-methoxyphenol hydroxylase-like FAD-dependent oxidoreductase
MLLGYLLARRGVDVVVLEKHADFLRDFRGDTVHPSTMEIMEQLGLADRVLALRHTKATALHFQTDQGPLPLADFRRLRSRYRYLMLVPQWDLLNLLAEEAKRLPSFRLLMSAEAQSLIVEDGVVRGVRYRRAGGEDEVRALLTVAADGRHSVLRAQSGLPVRETSAPMDVLWFRIRRTAGDPEEFTIRLGGGSLIVLLNRFDYWQVGYVIPKGAIERVRAAGLEAFRDSIRRLAPELGDRVLEVASWDDVKLLTVQSNRLLRWHLPGFLCIGDAAHAMSPVGGVGINLAIQDAVAAANRLASPLASGRLKKADLEAVERRRRWPTRVIQRLQTVVQNNLAVPALQGAKLAPRALRLAPRLPLFRHLTGRLVGLGVHRERVR